MYNIDGCIPHRCSCYQVCIQTIKNTGHNKVYFLNQRSVWSDHGENGVPNVTWNKFDNKMQKIHKNQVKIQTQVNQTPWADVILTLLSLGYAY